MPTLKDISRRLRSIISIQKITKSMKMVAASKYARAEKELKASKSFGSGAFEFYTKTGLTDQDLKLKTAVRTDLEAPVDKLLMIVMSSDKGLCGSIHAALARHIRHLMRGSDRPAHVKFVILGDKVKSMLQRQLSKDFIATGSGIGRKALSFTESSSIAETINDHITSFGNVEILYNQFRSIISYKPSVVPAMSALQMERSQCLANYDSVDSEVIRCFQEFQLASIVYYTFRENFTCELASRMNAMEGATKNAGELIDKLRLYYNRTRQSVITRELIEIISGASVLEKQRAS